MQLDQGSIYCYNVKHYADFIIVTLLYSMTLKLAAVDGFAVSLHSHCGRQGGSTRNYQWSLKWWKTPLITLPLTQHPWKISEPHFIFITTSIYTIGDNSQPETVFRGPYSPTTIKLGPCSSLSLASLPGATWRPDLPTHKNWYKPEWSGSAQLWQISLVI